MKKAMSKTGNAIKKAIIALGRYLRKRSERIKGASQLLFVIFIIFTSWRTFISYQQAITITKANAVFFNIKQDALAIQSGQDLLNFQYKYKFKAKPVVKSDSTVKDSVVKK